MTDVTFQIETADIEDGTAISVTLGAPVNKTYTGTVTDDAATIVAPSADVEPGTVQATVSADGVASSVVQLQAQVAANFDIAIAESSFTITNADDSAFTAPGQPGQTVMIRMLWQDTDGNYAGDSLVRGLQSSIGANPTFLRRVPGTNYNEYTYTFPAVVSVATNVDYTWGRYEDSTATVLQEAMARVALAAGGAVEKSVVKLTNNSSSSNSQISSHQYSTVNAFNADNTRIFLPLFSGDVIDLDGNVILTNHPFGGSVAANGNGVLAEYFWDCNIPNRMYGSPSGSSSLSYLDITETGMPQTTVFTTPTGQNLKIGSATGVPSLDCSRVVVNDNSNLYVIEIPSGNLLRQQPLPSGYDWTSISPNGEYYVVVSKSPNTTAVYEVSSGSLVRTSGDINHAALLEDATGNQYMAFVGNPAYLWNIVTGVRQNFTASAGYGHVSGANGRAYFSFDAGGALTQSVGSVAVGESYENDGIICDELPEHIFGAGSFAAAAYRISTSSDGKMSVITVSNPRNVPNEYLIRWF